MSNWSKFPESFPSQTGNYLCFVEVPSVGGSSIGVTRILGWYWEKGRWDCSGMIVRYWMPLPEPPEGGDAD